MCFCTTANYTEQLLKCNGLKKKTLLLTSSVFVNQCLLSECCTLNQVVTMTTQQYGCDWCYMCMLNIKKIFLECSLCKAKE